jgi:hypothetical protein
MLSVTGAAMIAAFVAGLAAHSGVWVVTLAILAVVCGLRALAKVVTCRRPVARFDRAANQLVYHSPTDTVSCSLDEVVAVQILRCAPPRGAADDREAWELNVVIGGASVSRFCLACGAPGDDCGAGRRLAEFLEVPLISHPIASTWAFGAQRVFARPPIHQPAPIDGQSPSEPSFTPSLRLLS